MGTLTIKTRSLATQAEYVNTQDGLTINLNYTQDASTGDLQNISGTIYHSADMSYAGNFNGTPNNGEIEYSMSGVKRRDIAIIYDALTDIEEQIAAENEPNAGE